LSGVVICAVVGVSYMKHRDMLRTRALIQENAQRRAAEATDTELVSTFRNRDSRSASFENAELGSRARAESTRSTSSSSPGRSRAPSALKQSALRNSQRSRADSTPLAEPPAVWRNPCRKNTNRSSFGDSVRSSFSASEAARSNEPPAPRKKTRVTFAELPSSFASELGEAKRLLEEALQREEAPRRSVVVDNSDNNDTIARVLQSPPLAASADQDSSSTPQPPKAEEDFKAEAGRKSSLSTWWDEDGNAVISNEDEVDDGCQPEASALRNSARLRQKTVGDWYAEGNEIDNSVSESAEVFDMETRSQGRKTLVPDAPPTFIMGGSFDSAELPSDVVADALDEIQRNSLTE